MNLSHAGFMRRPALLLFATLVAALIAACGSGEEEPTPIAAVEAPAAAEAVTPEPEAPAAEAAPAEEPTATPSAPAGDPQAAFAGDRAPLDRVDMYSAQPEMVIDPAKYYYATIKTEKGDVRIQLFADRAPITVNNFVYLAREGFYNGTTFHRVLSDFMAQAGDPTGTGAGGPGYTIPDEFVPGLNFDRAGLLAMANTGAPASGGSQWFITLAPTEWLNQRHTIFGEVLEGQDVVSSLTLRDPDAAPTEAGDLIETITIEETDASVLPTPSPMPPTPTPYPPSALDAADRPLAAIPAAEKANYFSAEPEMVIDPAQEYTATIVTAKGTMTVTLFADVAAKAVNNFVVLSNLGFFDGTPVNQVNPGTLLVLGSPDNSLQNDVGYRFVPEVGIEGAPQEGALAWAPLVPTAEGIQASGSILLIALAAPPAEASAQYGFFGQVTGGSDVLQTLAAGDLIESVTISVGQ